MIQVGERSLSDDFLLERYVLSPTPSRTEAGQMSVQLGSDVNMPMRAAQNEQREIKGLLSVWVHLTK